jgi:transcriptional regulator with XRE-family HTH domain
MCIFLFNMSRRSNPSRRPPSQTYPDLATYIEKTGDTQIEIARRVGTTQAYISRIASGRAVPRSLLAMRLATYAHIPLDSFTRVYLAKHAARTA